MNSVVILQDPPGYSQRVSALRAAHPAVYPVTPWDKPNGHCTSFYPPANWLPDDPGIPADRRCWWKADAMGLAAVRALGVDADFYWFIESDVVASQERWQALFRDWDGDSSDLVAPMIRSRSQRPDSAMWKSAPEWTTHFMLMCVFRISRTALEECIQCAEETRNIFSEVTIPSVVHRAGFKLAGLNDRQTHSNTQTLAAHAERVVINPRLLNHPVKADSYEPLVLRVTS